MFKLYAIIVLLAFLTSQTRSIVAAQDDVLDIQSTSNVKVNFISTTPLLPGVYTQELIVRPETCAIRVDIKNFTFSPPVQLTNTTAFACALDVDVFELILFPDLPKINISLLCGELSGQHIYLQTKDYDQTTLLDATVLETLNLRVTYLGLNDPPSWDITLTQIPCQLADDVNPELSQLSLPPDGCLQYYTELNGTIESFNFLGNSYFGGLNYTICFERTPDTCGIKLFGVEFGLSTNGDSSTDSDCDTAVELNAAVVSRDYLLIPNSRINGADGDVIVFATKYCGNSLLNREVIVESQDPLFITVVTDEVVNPLIAEVGFQINYEILTEC